MAVATMSRQPVPQTAAAATAPSDSASDVRAQHQQTLSQPQKINNAPPALNQQQQCYSSSYSSSPRQFPSELPDSIVEEGVESGSESLIEPVTPVSGRQSQDFTTLPQQDFQQLSSEQVSAVQSPHSISPKKASTLQQPPTSVPPTSVPPTSGAAAVPKPATTATATATAAPAPQQQDPQLTLSRRPTRNSSTNVSINGGSQQPNSFKRSFSFVQSVTNKFRRQNSATSTSGTPFDSAPASDVSLGGSTITAPAPAPSTSVPNGPPPTSRRFSNNQSSTTTRSNSPPSPSSPLEMAMSHRSTNGFLPAPDDFEKKNKRSSTGFSFRGRTVGFASSAKSNGRPRDGRRASSFDAGNRAPAQAGPSGHSENTHTENTIPPERMPWSMPPDAGTGVKARRMSLSLPDDFTVDVGSLKEEYDYQSRFGRHGKHVGKGSASKVSVMFRRDTPTELYAVKEFRGKSGQESQEDYDKKIKSEFSLAKSLHHPNIVETVRLCVDAQGRWNHVMEYCCEGDLFSLVSKGWIKGDDKTKDRNCLFKQLIQGVNYLHQHGVAHRDIKLENLLLTKDSKLKITDFGVSEVFCGTHPGLRESGGQCGQNMGEVRLCAPGICGSEPYIAPEVIAKKTSYDPRALDVWSSAIIMIYMTFSGAIWTRAEAGNPHFDTLVKGWEKWEAKHPDGQCIINEGDYPYCQPLDIGVNPPALRRILLQMLHPDPAKRITISEVANNRWMKGVECCQLESYDDPTHVIDATKTSAKNGTKKIFCHSHLPPKTHGSHSLGKMPGQPGY